MAAAPQEFQPAAVRHRPRRSRVRNRRVPQVLETDGLRNKRSVRMRTVGADRTGLGSQLLGYLWSGASTTETSRTIRRSRAQPQNATAAPSRYSSGERRRGHSSPDSAHS